VARGHEVVVISGTRDGVVAPDVVHEYSALLQPHHIGDASDDRVDELVEALDELRRRHRLDVIHGHNLHRFRRDPADAVARLASKTPTLGVHHTFHDVDVGSWTSTFAGWDGLHCMSRFVLRAWRATGLRQASYLHAGVNTQAFAPVAEPPAAPPLLLHPARLVPWKGAEVSLKILARIRQTGEDARLVLTDTPRTGDTRRTIDDYRRHLRELMTELDIEQHVQLGEFSYAEMPALYASSSVVLYPTIEDEPLGLAPLEAMSSGVPVVATRCGGIVETVVDGQTGYLFPRGNVDEGAAYVRRMLQDPGLAREVGRAGRARASGFELADHVDRLVVAYRRSGRRRS